MDQTQVSRETRGTDVPQVSQPVRNGRRVTRPLVEGADGRLRHIGSTWTDRELATLRLLYGANCAVKDIARHFNATPAAISQLAQRHRIRRPRPTVAEVLAQVEIEQLPAIELPRDDLPPAIPTAIPAVELIDRLEKHVAMVELHEVDDRHLCRVRMMASRGVRAGGIWKTVPLWQIRFLPGTERRAAIAAARDRHAATQVRRATLHAPSTNGEPENV